jgi:hypothetical protein
MARAKSALGKFEGRDVAAIKIIITKAGDGLSKAMAVEPKVLHQGDQGYLVLSYTTSKIRFDPSKGEEESTDRVQILEATGATFADRDLVGEIIDQMAARVAEHEEKERIAKEQSRGVFTFDATAEDDDNQEPF